jgi:hypothetical protein
VDDVLSRVNPKVKEFVDAAGAKVISLEDYDVLIGGMTKNDKTRLFLSGGFYNPTHDLIIINLARENLGGLNRTVLHELGHWSGHSTRLSRKVVVAGEKRDKNCTVADFDTEEITAEMIAYYLGDEMRLITDDWKEKSAKYIATWRKGNEHEASLHVKQAVWFLIKIAMPNMGTR